jgi:hypothetical protein
MIKVLNFPKEKCSVTSASDQFIHRVLGTSWSIDTLVYVAQPRTHGRAHPGWKSTIDYRALKLHRYELRCLFLTLLSGKKVRDRETSTQRRIGRERQRKTERQREREREESNPRGARISERERESETRQGKRNFAFDVCRQREESLRSLLLLRLSLSYALLVRARR